MYRYDEYDQSIVDARVEDEAALGEELDGHGLRQAGEGLLVELEPVTSDEDLALERNVILEEIGMVDDTPDDLVFERHNALLWGARGTGKSSLIRALVGVWVPARGKVRLDGAALDQWSSDELGRHVGYLPQDVELFAGSVAQNICRFDPDAKSDGIIAAAKEAGVHEMIIKMREGYDTQVGEQGTALSAGQAQRVVARVVASMRRRRRRTYRRAARRRRTGRPYRQRACRWRGPRGRDA